MPISRVQSKSGQVSPATSVTVTFNSATTSGNLLVLCVTSYYAGANAGGTWTVSDNKGNTWSSATSSDTFSRIQIFYAENITGGSSHQVTLSVSGIAAYMIATAVEYSGVATSSSLDQSGSAYTATNTTSYTSPTTGTTSQADELLIGCHHAYQSSATPTPSGSFSTVATQTGSTLHVHTVQDRIVSATGAYASAGTWSTTGANHTDGIATFKAAAGGGSTTYDYSGTGTVSFSGTAAIARDRSCAGSGPVALSGSAATALERAAIGGGSLSFSGAAATSRTRAASGAGTVTLSGTATVARARSFAGSGSVALSGAVSTARTRAWVGGGAVTISGTATASFTPAGGGTTYTYSGAGTVALSGAASAARSRSFAGSGTLTLAGTAATSRTRAYGGAGTVTLSGTATVSGPGATFTPSPLRTLPVGAAIRLVTVAASSRVLSVPAESRTA